ncbi:envelope protein [Wobbly possum disease virus]|uniref:Envelope protein n=1 Tax=Wobbly possum disease virus TaxID=1118369 RepID=G9FGR9_9NIDO|nr:envelope protein [Wobbly possum disease virus]AEU12349.1 envelope protein [Wobbly possum disease virus]
MRYMTPTHLPPVTMSSLTVTSCMKCWGMRRPSWSHSGIIAHTLDT